MALLTWIIRTIVILLIVRAVLRLMMPAPARTGGTGRRRTRAEKPERAGGSLVRDPHCGTYVPQSRALKVGIGANAQYFCSAACRDAFAAAHDSVAS